ncbi:MAG: hypothetical protein ACOYNI_12240 [Acidimicrobiia bacterium]
MRTIPCTDERRRARLAKAQEFLDAAQRLAGPDVHPRGEHHGDAVALLGSIDRDLANALDRVLRMKTRAGYGADQMGTADHKKAVRCATALVAAARATA